MIEFRQKVFTIPEGHYTGPKDDDKVPGALELIGKGAVGGAIIGGIVGKIDKDSTIGKGALEGSKYGALSGLVLKFFVNYLHNPMTRVKYQEVDKRIRREFGIYRAASITVGDTVDKRGRVEDKFSFNDRSIAKYKINFAVQNDQVTMYTYGLTDDELDKVSNSLDYYCKKYVGMEYASSLINQRMNSYAVVIVFTNYQVISNFLMEISDKLGTKINLLDNKALVNNRIFEAAQGVEEEEKTFSVAAINKYDIIKIIGKSGNLPIKSLKTDWKQSISSFCIGLILNATQKLSKDELTKNGMPAPREDFNNPFLESELKRLRYAEGFNYTVKKESATSNMSLNSGLFVVTVEKGEDSKKTDENYWSALKTKINRTDTGKVIVYTYWIESRNNFEFLLKKLMSTGLVFNIFE